jgi:hypothetical protein
MLGANSRYQLADRQNSSGVNGSTMNWKLGAGHRLLDEGWPPAETDVSPKVTAEQAFATDLSQLIPQCASKFQHQNPGRGVAGHAELLEEIRDGHLSLGGGDHHRGVHR